METVDQKQQFDIDLPPPLPPGATLGSKVAKPVTQRPSAHSVQPEPTVALPPDVLPAPRVPKPRSIPLVQPRQVVQPCEAAPPQAKQPSNAWVIIGCFGMLVMTVCVIAWVNGYAKREAGEIATSASPSDDTPTSEQRDRGEHLPRAKPEVAVDAPSAEALIDTGGLPQDENNASRLGAELGRLPTTRSDAANGESDPQRLFEKGLESGQRGRWPEAVAAFRDLVAIEDANALAWCNLGWAHSNQNDVQGAISAYENAVRVSPDLTDAWFGLTVSYVLLSDFTKAEAALNRLRSLAPDRARQAIDWMGADVVQTLAVNRFPALAVRDSPLNVEFRKRYQRYRTDSAAYFADAEWPLRLAQEAAEAVATPSSRRATNGATNSTKKAFEWRGSIYKVSPELWDELNRRRRSVEEKNSGIAQLSNQIYQFEEQRSRAKAKGGRRKPSKERAALAAALTKATAERDAGATYIDRLVTSYASTRNEP